MNNIVVRGISGSIFISLVLVPLFLSNPVFLTATLFFFMVVGLIEYNNFFNQSNTISINKPLNVIFPLLISGVAILLRAEFTFPLFFLWAIIELWRQKENPLLNISTSIFGFIYVSLPLILALKLHALTLEFTFPILAGMFLLIWTNDTFAFLTGKFLGKTKLFERISPKKTWEGTIGGIVFTALMAFGISQLLDVENTLFWVIAALIVAPSAIFGDLLESLFKRSLGIKDSGTIMPGHGGILDRFDATLFTVPFFYVWTIIYFNL